MDKYMKAIKIFLSLFYYTAIFSMQLIYNLVDELNLIDSTFTYNDLYMYYDNVLFSPYIIFGYFEFAVYYLGVYLLLPWVAVIFVYNYSNNVTWFKWNLVINVIIISTVFCILFAILPYGADYSIIDLVLSIVPHLLFYMLAKNKCKVQKLKY